MRADRIHTPLLIVHGRDDLTCPVSDAEKMFSALHRLGRTAQLAVYEGEGHAIHEWDSKGAIDAADRMLDFLRRQMEIGRTPSQRPVIGAAVVRWERDDSPGLPRPRARGDGPQAGVIAAIRAT